VTAFRFREFELDVGAYQLRRGGQPVRLERRPMDLLILLVEHPGELISREAIVRRLWGERAFVDVDMGINTAVRKLRSALEDSSATPQFIETVPARGYRFLPAVEPLAPARAESPARITLAVLPFENLKDDPDQDYLADGLTEEAIVALGQIDPERLAVIGRTSVMAYRRTTKLLSQIGQELNAEYLVESSVRTEGPRLRITCKLIRARDQCQVWSASFDNEPSQILDFQRELCTAIAEKIALRISPTRLDALARRHPRDARAYDLYLRGQYYWKQLTPSTTKRAVEYYARAAETDPQYALAWSGLADAYASSPISTDAPPLPLLERARDAVRRAQTSEPELAEVQTSIGFLNFFLEWDWPKAEVAYQKAIALDANYPLAHRMLGVLYTHCGRHDAARAAMRRARELDLYAMHYALSAMVELHAHDFPAAVQFGRHATVLAPDFWIGHFQLAQAYEQLGEHDLALEANASASRLSGGNSKTLGLRGYILAKAGRSDEAREVLATLDAISRERNYPPYAAALVLVGLGQTERALQYLESALLVRDVHLLFLPIDPKWDGLRSDARFADLIRRCGLVPPALVDRDTR
jgi:TolB-like protein/Tfp pilus assembly protein PilF